MVKNKKTITNATELRKKKPGEVWLNLGCGGWFRKGFINVDNYIDEEAMKKGIKSKEGRYKNCIVEKDAKFVKADIKHLPFPDNYADYVELMNTIEHFPIYQVVENMKEVCRVMKPGAKLIILTNNFDGLFADWLTNVANPPFDIKEYCNIAEEIFGNQVGGEGETHKCPFNVTFMNYVLVQAGFKDGTIGILKKGTVMPMVGTVKAANKNAVCRNDLLIAEVTK
jgi:ubiquinone/menaquinone biosynthesis C-methylase UbiE